MSNPNHDRIGRFSRGGVGGGAAKNSEVSAGGVGGKQSTREIAKQITKLNRHAKYHEEQSNRLFHTHGRRSATDLAKAGGFRAQAAALASKISKK